MQNDRKRWNEKYLSETYSVDPSPIVKKFYKMAPGGIALDIAAGTGRNAIFLAEKGFQVDAVDISDVGLRKISKGTRICIRFVSISTPLIFPETATVSF